MPLIEMLPYLSLQSMVSLLMVFAVGLVAALALLGLRFARRGPARFWLAPSFVTLAWLPLVAGASLAALGVVRVAEAAALVGTGSIAAIQAGLMEAELPLLLGLLGTAGVAGLGLALLAVGRSGQAASPSPESASFVPPAVAVALSVISLGLGLGVPAVAHWLTTSPSGAATFARALAWTAAGVALLVLVSAFTLALRAPRGSAPARTCSLSLGALGALVACALATAVAGAVWLQRTPLSEGTSVSTAPVELPRVHPTEPPPVEADIASQALAPAPARVASTPIPPTSGPGAAGTPVDPLRVGGTIREPKKLKNVAPGYPPAALRARVQGTVILECLIGADGRVARVKVLRGVPLLDEAAMEAVRQWEYEPTQVNGVPVPVIMTVTVNFKLS
jgi:TonB family protein